MDEKVAHARSGMRPWTYFPIVLMRDGLWSGWLVGGLMALGIVLRPTVIGSFGDDWRAPILAVLLMGLFGWTLGLFEGMFLAFIAAWRPLSFLNLRNSPALQWLIGASWGLMACVIALITLEGVDGWVTGIVSLGLTSLGSWLAYRAGMRAIRGYVALPPPLLPEVLLSFARDGVSFSLMARGVRRSLPYSLPLGGVLTVFTMLGFDSVMMALGTFVGTIVGGVVVGAFASWAFGFWAILAPFPITLEVWWRCVFWVCGGFFTLLAYTFVDATGNVNLLMNEVVAELGLLIGSVGMIGSVALEVHRWIKERQNPTPEVIEDFERTVDGFNQTLTHTLDIALKLRMMEESLKEREAVEAKLSDPNHNG